MFKFFDQLRNDTSAGAMLAGVSYNAFLILALSAALISGTDWRQRALNVAAACCGIGFGWVLGIGVSPSDEIERTEFSTFSKAISTFATGYVAGLVKGVTLAQVTGFLRQEHVLLRVLLGVGCALATMAIEFTGRRAELQNRRLRWFIRYEPRSANVPNATPLGLLGVGPFADASSADAEINQLRQQAAFSGVSLTAVAQR